MIICWIVIFSRPWHLLLLHFFLKAVLFFVETVFILLGLLLVPLFEDFLLLLFKWDESFLLWLIFCKSLNSRIKRGLLNHQIWIYLDLPRQIINNRSMMLLIYPNRRNLILLRHKQRSLCLRSKHSHQLPFRFLQLIENPFIII